MEDTRTAAVTGASNEFGAAAARHLEDAGYAVLASDGAVLPAGFEQADILVLAHGVMPAEPDWLTCPPDEWRSMRTTGIDSMFMDVQAYANARLAAERQGSVVILTADASHAEDGSDVLRSAISWGVRGLVRNASAAYARKGVRVNGVCLDGASPADAAALAAFLAEGEHITGQTIPVAGGRALL